MPVWASALGSLIACEIDYQPLSLEAGKGLVWPATWLARNTESSIAQAAGDFDPRLS